MKKIIYTITVLIAFAVSANAQVGIETEDVSPKAILDFPDGADGGILLPYVGNPATVGDVAGTLIYNAEDGIIYYRDNVEWIKLTGSVAPGTRVRHDTATYPDLDSDGVVVSNTGQPTNVKGVLVLESKNRALALPKVDGVENIQSPKTGMICYDKSRKSLAIFNGEKWILRN